MHSVIIARALTQKMAISSCKTQQSDLNNALSLIKKFLTAASYRVTSISALIISDNITIMQTVSAQLVQIKQVFYSLLFGISNNNTNTANATASAVLSTLVTNFTQNFDALGKLTYALEER